MQAAASFLEIAIITLVVNARYLLMSCALAQRFDPETPMIHRFFVGFGITDEIFGITIARPGTIQPVYNYGAILFAAILWALGTSMGIIAGNFLPARVVSALSVALYGMFLAIIIPPARKNLVIAIAVAVSFLCSYLCGIIPYVKELSSGTRTIILTVVIASIVAIIKPIEEDPSTSSGTAGCYHFFSITSQMFISSAASGLISKNLAFSMLGTTFTVSPRRNSAVAVVLAIMLCPLLEIR